MKVNNSVLNILNITLEISLLLLFIFIFLSADYSINRMSIPIMNFHVLFRDILLYFIFFLFFFISFFNKKILIKGLFYKEILLIFLVYYIFIPIGFLNGNLIKNMFHNIRYVNYIMIYFPLLYLFRENMSYKNYLLKFFSIILLFSCLFNIVLLFIFCNNTIPLRNEFFWIDYKANLIVPRILIPFSSIFPVALIFIVYFYRGLKSFMIELLLLMLIAVSFYRSLWVISFSSLFFIFILAKSYEDKFNILKITLISVLIISSFIFIFEKTGVVKVVNSMVSTKEITNIDRINEHKFFWNKFIKNPLIGYGQGATINFFFYSFGKEIETTFLHNVYLIYLLNFGIIGTFFILWAFLSFIIKTFYFLKKNKQKSIAEPLLSSFLAILIVSIFTSDIYYSKGYVFIAIVMALTSDYIEKNENYLA